jgi:hypothetical protein
MKKIYLRKVLIENFKGIRHYEKEFNNEENLIQAKFGSGKSTIKQSLNYVFGLKVENFRPYLVKDNVWVENENAGATNVEWSIEVDGVIPMTYKFQIKDTGKTSSYFIDDIKYPSKKAYQSKLIEYLGLLNIEQLETLSNLDYFLNLKWQEQREVLKRITGVNEVLKEVQLKEEYALLYQQYFIKNVSELDVKKSLKQRRKSLEQEKLTNDTIIADCNKSLSNLQNVDFEKVKSEIQAIDKQIRELDDVTKQAQIQKLQLELSQIRQEQQNEIHSLDLTINGCCAEKRIVSSDINDLVLANEDRKGKIKSIEELIEQLENEKFNENVNTICPYCNAEMSLDSLREQYYAEKNSKIETLKKNKNELNADLERDSATITSLQVKLKEVEDNISKLKTDKEQIEDDFMCKSDAVEIEIYNLEQTNNSNKIQQLNLQKNELMKNLASEQLYLHTKSMLEEKTKKQIELVKSEQELAILEELLDKYSNETQSIFTDHINSYFQDEIKWQFFSKLVSTNESTEDCILLCKEKRYDTACSTGERLMARVLVVQGLQKIVDINFPIFVDDFNDLGIKFESSQQLILLETKSGVELENAEKY